jgi:hypothetical protein
MTEFPLYNIRRLNLHVGRCPFLDEEDLCYLITAAVPIRTEPRGRHPKLSLIMSLGNIHYAKTQQINSIRHE